VNIEWTISKKRGNFRPVLHYTMRLTDFEKSVGMPAVRVQSTIPRPPDPGLTYCWPGQNERAEWTPAEHYLLTTPPHTVGEANERIKLPWREHNLYPEVEESFLLLRAACELALRESAGSEPMQAEGRLETSGEAKKCIAPALVAERILQVIK